ncbi:precorrin-6A/cobalt-precorrin-6A reductase [Desulfotomaculum arcticum]|uniref:Precorrin-6A/cobalt-precorrin-6A reductase n=1 Tax=Desulfotruncus arcticus DSM 17038 TaxID=1121424 RepID=A0A1I2RVJ5_9FIRM|nr:precorrin-6A reductase [Desulfotruncus arcticus]SFG44588.1 precorrin-6A/cobalt-precorrin-6A reductase [Desulfotomaculum arcticum] [Desulfotruncus arcticus DSM 17038]
MILILGGTSESKEITTALVREGYQVIVCAATPYGGSLLKEAGANEVIQQRLGTREIIDLIQTRGIQLLIDATHPFAELVTANAQSACRQTGIIYIRYERPGCIIPEHTLIHRVPGYTDAAKKAVELAGETVFTTTGTKTLSVFCHAAQSRGKRVVARILPDLDGLKLCLDLGISPVDIIAMQGPFSIALNKALLNDFRADVLVTKDSGAIGGTVAKIEAALSLSIPVVLIERPISVHGSVSSSVGTTEQLLTKILDLERNDYI